MAKNKITVTIDPRVLSDTDADAASAGLNRSEYVEKVLQDAHYRRLLAAAASTPPLTGSEEEQLRGLLDWQRDLGQTA
jgi:hypothetical protein